MFYEVFWVLLVGYLVPRYSPCLVGAVVLLATSGLELLQLWQVGWLEAFRKTLLGGALIGSSFDPADFLYYIVGCSLGVLLLYAFRRHQEL